MITINIGSAFIDFFDQVAGAIFVDGFAVLLNALAVPEWLVVLLADGAEKINKGTANINSDHKHQIHHQEKKGNT
jgi:hypothetical protein